MSKIGFGFDGDEEKEGIKINYDEVNKLTKEYKKLKKYMKTNLYEIQTLSGQETKISKLLKDYGDTADGASERQTETNS
jgi:hypothetical protein